MYTSTCTYTCRCGQLYLLLLVMWYVHVYILVVYGDLPIWSMSIKYCLKVFQSYFTRSKDIKVIIIIYKKLLFLYVHVLIFCTIQYMYIHVYMYMLCAISEFAQSADCVTQTEDPQNACQSADCSNCWTTSFITTTNTSLVVLIYFYQLLSQTKNKDK